MNQTAYRRVLGAGKCLAMIATAIAVTGCVSDGTSQTAAGSTSPTSSSPPAQSTVGVSAPSSSATGSTAATTSTTTSKPTTPPQTSSTSSTSNTQGSGSSVTAPGESLIFSYANGFANASTTLRTAFSAQFNGSLVALTSPTYGQHQAGAIWSVMPQNIKSFTTDFTFQLDPSAFGITFCIQNTTDASAGDNVTADANMLGYGTYPGQPPINHSVAVKFDLTSANSQASLGPIANSTGLYINGGPSGYIGFLPEADLNSSRVDLHSGHVMDAHIVYDGSILTLTLRDTQTNAQARMSWPINIPAIAGSDYAYVGITAGTIPAVSQNLLTWSYWSGYSQELPAPTFSLSAGQYSGTQSVSISTTPGATIYYTTNGHSPTTSSARYTNPVAISSSTVLQAIAVESGQTDSTVASAYYQIAPPGTPSIDFPSGFASASNLVVVNGATSITGSDIALTDTSHFNESGSAWFASPVNVQYFKTNFIVNLSGPASANGFTFTIQNQNPTSTDLTGLAVSGGPSAVSMPASGLGYEGLNSSVAVIFDLYDGSGDLTGLYTDGAAPTGSSIDMSSSGLSLHSGNPLAVTITYNGVTLAMTVTDTKSQASFSKAWTIDIPTLVGGNNAYVGFTGGTGGQTALQEISSWTYSN